MWETGTLPAGDHTVKIERTGIKRKAATGTNIDIDAVDVAGTLLSSTRVQQDSALIAYAGGWSSTSTKAASGGSFVYANTAGSSATINFTGVRLNILARTAGAYGIMKITLDGTTTFKVDLYSWATAYRTVWSSGILVPGDHTVKIEWTGTKRRTSTGTTIAIDAVDVLGTLK